MDGVGSMKAETFDVVILGGGNAGIGVTGPVRRSGMSVAMIESHDLGGTCPNRGCTPKKVLVAAGHALHEIERAAVHHIAVGKPKLDWAALIDREKDMIKDIPANLARSMAHRNVEVIRGHAVFVGPNVIRVGERRLEAKHIVIATGSKPRPLPIPGAGHMITSDTMLSERELPGSVIFVGGGVISLEFGHVYARAGAEVTILEALPQLLPAMDADAVAHIQAESERIGIHIKTGVTVKRIEPANGRLRVIFSHDGQEHAAETDRVVNGAGRVANVDTLDLAAGNVEHSNGRVAVDRHLRSTSNPIVHVCGDAVPISPQLSPIATYEGDIVGRNIVEGPKYSPDYGSMATAVYTVPALAAVGLTEAAANQKGLAIKVQSNDMQEWFSARTYAETVAWSKIIVDQATDRILGAHFVGHAGQELVNLFGFAMRFGITSNQIKDNVYAYPTFSSDIKHML
jgi:glutathione reductase (NADPH)